MERNKLEAELIHLLQRAEGPYRRALALIETSLPQSQPTADDISACLVRLEPLMKQTEEVERELAPCRQQWTDAGYRATPELKSVFQQHGQLLSTLIEKVNALEQRMQELRRQARPQVDAVVRHHQMQRAYQHSGRTA